MIRTPALALAVTLFLGGCATQPRAYDPSDSRALNVAKAAGLSKAEDYPADKIPGVGISGLLDVTTSALSFESANGLDLAMGDAVGLGLLSFVFSPPAQMDRNALLAWIPEEQAKDRDEAALVLSKLVLDAIETTLNAEGIAYHIEKAHQERLALFYPFLETRLDFDLDGKNCGVSYQVYKTQTVGPKPTPTFIGNGGSAYGFLAGHEIQYPSFDVGCLGADPIHSIELARKISQALPETVFLYISPKRRPEGGRTPPMVLDHGKALMFIEPAANDRADSRAAPVNRSNGAGSQEQSHPRQGAAS